MKDKKLKDCNLCQEAIVRGISDVVLCVVERQRPSTEDYPKNLNIETEDIFYHQECYKKKHGITVSKTKEEIEFEEMRKKVREAIVESYRIPEEETNEG
jgi:hypothetical protein